MLECTTFQIKFNLLFINIEIVLSPFLYQYFQIYIVSAIKHVVLLNQIDAHNRVSYTTVYYISHLELLERTWPINEARSIHPRMVASHQAVYIFLPFNYCYANIYATFVKNFKLYVYRIKNIFFP